MPYRWWELPQGLLPLLYWLTENLAIPASLNPGLIAGGLALLNVVPAITQIAETFENTDPDVSLHIEAFYQLQLTDNISI